MLKRALKLLVASTVILISGCMSPPDGLDLSMRRPTAKNSYVVELQPIDDPHALNRIHKWEARVMTPDGAPVSRAKIAVDGGMPQHRHGLPTRPAVIDEPEPGRYIIGGVKFSMNGWWEIKLNIRSALAEDTVTFNTVVGKSSGAQ